MDVCRTCLEDKQLHAIFQNPRKSSQYTAVLYHIAGVQVNSHDGLSKSICQTCILFINSALKFRAQSQRSHKILVQRSSSLTQNINKSIKDEVETKFEEAKIFATYFPDSNTEKDDIEDPLSKNDIKSDDIHAKRDSAKDIRMLIETKRKDFANEDFSTTASSDNSVFDFDDNFERFNVASGSEKKETIDNEVNRRCGDDNSIDKCNDEDVTNLRGTDEYLLNKLLVMKRPVGMKRKDKKKLLSKEEKNIANYSPLVRHQKNGLVQCPICKMKFGSVQAWKLHAQKHFGYKFVCEYCGKGLQCYTYLLNHYMTNHGMERQMSCSQCDYRCVTRAELKVHMRTHTGERPFICDACGMTFLRRFCLVKHLQRHTGVKKFQCDRCQKTYISKSELAVHRNSAHERTFAYSCPLCSRTYAKNMTVRRHLVLQHAVPRERQGRVARVRVA